MFQYVIAALKAIFSKEPEIPEPNEPRYNLRPRTPKNYQEDDKIDEDELDTTSYND